MSLLQRKREISNQKPNFEETLSLWKAFPQLNRAANSALSDSSLASYIKASTNKSFWDSHSTADEVSEPALTAKREDFSSFGGVHQDCGVAIYKIPLQGWEGVS